MSSEYEIELQLEQDNEKRRKVITMTAEGKKISEISRETGLGFKQIREINQEFAAAAGSDSWIRQRAKEIIGYMDVHHTSIIERLYDIEQEARLNGDTKIQLDALSKIMAAEKDRVTFLRAAGIISDSGIGEQVAAFERDKAELMQILQEIRKEHPEVAGYIREKMERRAIDQ